jgi:adenylyl cyclase-associated protein
LVKQVFDEQRRLLATTLSHKKPDAGTLQQLLKTTSEALGKITELKEKNRPSPLFNHLSAVAEGMPALGWVAVEPKPAPFIGEMKDAAQFYTNRILKEYKEKDKTHVEWSASFTAVLVELQTFVKKYHTTGLIWSATGADAKNAVGAAPVAATPAPAASAPVAAAAPVKPAGPGLFAELNKGGDITSGLKKVEKSQMTHKNPALRASSVVKAEEKAPGKLLID